MKTSSVIIALAIAILSVSLWALANRPEQEPPWPTRIQGFSFSPFHSDQTPLDGKYPSEKQLDVDLALLKGKTHAIRTYTVEKTLAKIPALAQKNGMNVALGVWIDDDYERNEADLQTMEQIVGTQFNIVRVIIGNEAVLRGDVPIEKMIEYGPDKNQAGCPHQHRRTMARMAQTS
jgi:exo-beta-1,3-glucanase (GH17 family)